MLGSAELERHRFYGWTALSGAMLIFFGMIGTAVIAYGIFLPVICDELNLSRSILSGPYSGFWIAQAVFGPITGVCVKKFGARKVLVFGNILAALGLLGMSQAKEVWHFYLFFSILLGSGQSFGTMIACNVIVTNWFTRKRSLAMGLLTAAGGIGGLVMAPVIGWLIPGIGWQLSWVCLSGLRVLLLIVGGMLIRNTPEELGQVPDGEAAVIAQKTGGNSPVPKRVYQTAVDWMVGDALRTASLWLIVAFAAVHLFTLSLITLHQVSYLQDAGFSPMTAASTSGIFAGASVLGQLLSGALALRFEGRYLAVACLVGFLTGVVILMNANVLPMVYLYTIVTGMSAGGLIVLVPVMLAAYFGRADFARISGCTVPVTQLVSAFGPLIAGFIYDARGSYTVALMIAVALLGVGLLSAFMARPPKLKLHVQ